MGMQNKQPQNNGTRKRPFVLGKEDLDQANKLLNRKEREKLIPPNHQILVLVKDDDQEV